MPNGGSDCCLTCWFNSTNRGYRNWMDQRDESIPPYCEIRDLEIEDPAYTYCANHPHRRPNRDRTPIGPVFQGDSFGHRKLWKQGPDTPEVREHLLDIVRDMFENRPFSGRDSTRGLEYPLGIPSMSVVLTELVRLKEVRLLNVLRGYAKAGPGAEVRKAARDLLAQVQQDLEDPRRVNDSDSD